MWLCVTVPNGVTLLNADPRHISTVVAPPGSPAGMAQDLDMRHVALTDQDFTRPAMTIGSIAPYHHLEVSLRIPPYYINLTKGTPYDMSIRIFLQYLDETCDTPGVTVFTNDKHPYNNFNECGRMMTPPCDFRCTCFKKSEDSCKVYIRMEWPLFGSWELPYEINEIEHYWI